MAGNLDILKVIRGYQSQSDSDSDFDSLPEENFTFEDISDIEENE